VIFELNCCCLVAGGAPYIILFVALFQSCLQELWLDFIADTGDGGNPTYAVARALAAQELVVPVAKSSSSSSTSNTNKLSNAVVDSKAKQQQPQHQQASASNRFSSSSSSILEGATGSGACQNGQLELPRGEVLLIGGDLAYPNPSRETFEQRLFVPFQEALPPPPHYHPGKPDADRRGRNR